MFVVTVSPNLVAIYRGDCGGGDDDDGGRGSDQEGAKGVVEMNNAFVKKI